MRSELGLVRILSPRAPHVVAAELRTHELSVEAIPLPRFVSEAPPMQMIAALPAFLLVSRSHRHSTRGRRRN